jgi:cobalt-zinc-cadmium efflux system protein
MGHGHGHHSHDTPTRRLSIALGLTGSFLVVELVAGLWLGSLALLSDAGHMATDTGALILALFAQAIAGRARSGEKTFGYRRAEILAALANGVVLGATSVWIVVEAISRFRAPPPIDGLPLLVVATMGLAINLLSAWFLSAATGSNPNVRAAAAHVASDALGSLAAMIAGLCLLLFGWRLVDPIVSIAISLLILRSAWVLIKESVDVLMEATPPGLDARAIERTIAETPGVAAIHDLHVWSISDGFPAVTVHVVLDGNCHGTEVATAVSARVRAVHGVEHVTVQPESPEPPMVPLASLTTRRPR